jgi:hypothetical protein
MTKHTPGPSFNVSTEEARQIHLIAKRSVELAKRFHVKWDLLSIEMDITATHANGCPLRLAELMTAKDLDFSHDIGGILKYLDRNTGKLTNCFLPRFASHKALEALYAKGG